MAPLLKLMEAYCARTGLQMDQVSVEFDGNRLLGNRTPEPLQMEDDDQMFACLSPRMQWARVPQWASRSKLQNLTFTRFTKKTVVKYAS
jgi:hypothetical protein